MAGRISRDCIDELVTRADIVSLIDSYVTLRKSGQNYTALCPFHNEKTPSFTVSPDKQIYYCFGCGVYGNALNFIENYANLSFVEAVHELASRVGMEVVYEQGHAPISSIESHQALYELMAQVAQYYQQQLRLNPIAIGYLKQRGLTGEIAKEFGIGYAPDGWNHLSTFLNAGTDLQAQLLTVGLLKKSEQGHCYDFFRHRIMFPIHDQRGRVIAFGGRVLDDSKPKYLNSPDTPLFQKSRELYAWHLARKTRPLERIIIVEGYMDVVALAQYGIRNVVAALGTAITYDHLQRLFRSVTEITFCFDGDEAGRKAASRALQTVLPLLQDGRQVDVAFFPETDDQDSLVRREDTAGFQVFLTQAMPLSQFLFDDLKKRVNLATLEGQTKLVEKAKSLLEQLPMGLYREAMWQQLSKLVPMVTVDSKKLTTLILNEPSSKLHKPGTLEFAGLSRVQQAIVYLLQQPTLAQSITYPDKKLAGLELPDVTLLLELIEFIRKNPNVTLAVICEHWRDSPYAAMINYLMQCKLLAQDPLRRTDTGINSEIEAGFKGAIKSLQDGYNKQRQNFLLNKSKYSRLTEEETQELRLLIKPIH